MRYYLEKKKTNQNKQTNGKPNETERNSYDNGGTGECVHLDAFYLYLKFFFFLYNQINMIEIFSN